MILVPDPVRLSTPVSATIAVAKIVTAKGIRRVIRVLEKPFPKKTLARWQERPKGIQGYGASLGMMLYHLQKALRRRQPQQIVVAFTPNLIQCAYDRIQFRGLVVFE